MLGGVQAFVDASITKLNREGDSGGETTVNILHSKDQEEYVKKAFL